MAAGGGLRPAIAEAAPSSMPQPQARAIEVPRLESFADLLALAGEKRELKLKHALETAVRPIRFEPGRIEVALTEHAAPGLAGELSKKLEAWTGARWMVAVNRDGGGETVAETRRNARAKLVDDARADPVVAAVFERFPGAEIVDVRVRGEEPALGADGPALSPDEAMLDDIPNEDD
jgi:DNA polymerase-3 subunit gamma/tau